MRVTGRAGSPANAQTMTDEIAAEVRRRLGFAVYGEGEQLFEAAIAGLLRERGLSLALVESNTGRLSQIESGDLVVVGVNKYTETEVSPLSSGSDAIIVVDPAVETEQIEKLKAWRAARNQKQADAALAEVERAAKEGRNIMEPSIAAARAGVTTGEWAGALRKIFGEYRAPTGVAQAAVAREGKALEAVRTSVEVVSNKLGRRVKFLVGKPGLDGHSNGAEQIAARARDCGMEITYDGIRLTPEQIVMTAREKKVTLIGLSVLSGSHVPLVREVMNRLRQAGLAHIPVVVGGIIPSEDTLVLKQLGVSRVYTPKDFDLNIIMNDLVDLLEARVSH